MSDPLIFEALRKLDEATRLLRLIVEEKPTADGLVETEDGLMDVLFLNQRLDQLDFGPGYTVRLRQMFEAGNFAAYSKYEQEVVSPLITVRDLVSLSEAQVLRQVNIGKQSLLRLKAMLTPRGLRFGMRDVKLRSVA